MDAYELIFEMHTNPEKIPGWIANVRDVTCSYIEITDDGSIKGVTGLFADETCLDSIVISALTIRNEMPDKLNKRAHAALASAEQALEDWQQGTALRELVSAAAWACAPADFEHETTIQGVTVSVNEVAVGV